MALGGSALTALGGFRPAAATDEPASPINLNKAPYRCGLHQTSAYNRDAIAAAVARLPAGGTIEFSGEIPIAPGDEAYIKLHKGITFRGHGWYSTLVPDPDIPSKKPVIWALGVPSDPPEDFFHVVFERFKIGNPYYRGGWRQGGTGIRVEANASNAGTENSRIRDVYIHDGRYGAESYGVELIHSTESNYGPIYNFNIEHCQIMGGIRCVRIADSVRIMDCMLYGEGAIDIDCRPTEGKFTFHRNNVSCEGGVILRSGLNPSFCSNIITMQRVNAELRAYFDLSGDIEPIYNVTYFDNRLHNEQAENGVPITTLLMHVGRVTNLAISHSNFTNPLSNVPIEFSEESSGVELGVGNTWQIGHGTPRFANRSQQPVLEVAYRKAEP